MDKRVTIKDIARETGLSIAAVSYVLNSKEGVGEETRDAVMEAVKRLGYVPNFTARGLVSNHSKLIGVCSPQTEPSNMLIFNNPFYSELFSSIEYECRKEGYHVIISGTDADESFLKLAQQRNLDGMIVIGSYSDSVYNELKNASIPVVLMDTYHHSGGFHEVKIDDRLGGYIATKYLIEKGHGNIAFVSGEIRENGVTQLRYEGYRDALKERGIPVNERFVFPGIVDFESGFASAGKIIENAPEVTALFCTADIIAIGALKKLNDMGVRVPERLSVMGFDNLHISGYTSPSLTTVAQDIQLKGKAAVELILNHISGGDIVPQSRVLPLKIMERQSVREI